MRGPALRPRSSVAEHRFCNSGAAGSIPCRGHQFCGLVFKVRIPGSEPGELGSIPRPATSLIGVSFQVCEVATPRFGRGSQGFESSAPNQFRPFDQRTSRWPLKPETRGQHPHGRPQRERGGRVDAAALKPAVQSCGFKSCRSHQGVPMAERETRSVEGRVSSRRGGSNPPRHTRLRGWANW
jgi:hypothetical protein